MTADAAKYGDKDVTAKVLAILTPGAWVDHLHLCTGSSVVCRWAMNSLSSNVRIGKGQQRSDITPGGLVDASSKIAMHKTTELTSTSEGSWVAGNWVPKCMSQLAARCQLYIASDESRYCRCCQSDPCCWCVSRVQVARLSTALRQQSQQPMATVRMVCLWAWCWTAQASTQSQEDRWGPAAVDIERTARQCCTAWLHAIMQYTIKWGCAPEQWLCCVAIV